MVTTPAPVPSHRPTGVCVRCRRVKIKCTYPEDQAKCRSCLRGGYECVFISKAERTAEKRRRAREFENARSRGSMSQGSPQPSADAASTPTALPPPSPHSAGGEHQEDELSADLLNQCRESLQKFLWPFAPLHWPSFRKKLADNTLPKSLYYAMLAYSSRATRKLAAQFGSPVAASDYFASKSRQLILDNLDHVSLEDVQALLLIIVLDWGSSRGTRAFMYLGMAARMALSFLPEADHRLSKDFLAAETARRTIWMVYMVEQFLSSGNGRIPSIRAREIPISLPCSEMDYLFAIPSIVPMFDGGIPPLPPSQEESTGRVGEFGLMIQISSIWNSVATWRFRCRPDDTAEAQLDQLQEVLSNWRTSLPSQYKDEPGHLDLHVSLGTGFAFGFTHTAFHCALIFLHRERLYACNRELDPPPSCREICDKSIETIFSSAERIVEILNTLEATGTDDDNVVIFPIFMLYACFTASATIAYISTKQWASSRKVSFKIVRESLRILRSMTYTWPLVNEWYVQLSSMVRVLQDRARGIESAAAPDPPFERLPYGHVRTQTPDLPIGRPLSVMESSTIADIDTSDLRGGLGPPNYFAELSPSCPYDLDWFLNNQDDLSIFLG